MVSGLAYVGKGDINNQYEESLSLPGVCYADRKYAELCERNTETVQKYVSLVGKKEGFLDSVSWAFNEKRRASVAAAKKVLEERGELEKSLE